MSSDHPKNQLSLQLSDSAPGNWQILPLADADVRLMRDFLDPQQATEIENRLIDQVTWRRDSVHVFGRKHLIPRLHQWYGDPDAIYSWSGIQMHPQPWLEDLSELRKKLQTLLGCRFNSVLINLYRDGKDSMGWHADNEKELGNQPVIASISLGAERDFLLRSCDKHSDGQARSISLNHGSLLLMAGKTQQQWQHSLPRRLRVRAPRINLTFRQISELQA